MPDVIQSSINRIELFLILIRATSRAGTATYAPWEVSGCKGYRLGGGAGRERGRNGQRQAGAVGGAPVASIPPESTPAGTKLQTTAPVFVFIGGFATLSSVMSLRVQCGDLRQRACFANPLPVLILRRCDSFCSLGHFRNVLPVLILLRCGDPCEQGGILSVDCRLGDGVVGQCRGLSEAPWVRSERPLLCPGGGGFGEPLGADGLGSVEGGVKHQGYVERKTATLPGRRGISP